MSDAEMAAAAVAAFEAEVLIAPVPPVAPVAWGSKQTLWFADGHPARHAGLQAFCALPGTQELAHQRVGP